MAYKFFLSYARRDRDHYLDKFFKDLCGAVALKSGIALNASGFMDGWTMDVGENWVHELFNGLQSSSVLVPIYTPTYFQRPVCGKEWEVFRLRQREHAVVFKKPEPPVILPVLWVPEEDLHGSLPEGARSIQHDNYIFGDVYAQEGLRTLMTRSTHRNRYRDFVDRFARRIIKRAARYRLPRARLEKDEAGTPRLDTVANAFRQGVPRGGEPRIGPRHVNFVYVAATRSEIAGQRQRLDSYSDSPLEWHPYHPDPPNEIVQLAEDTAAARKFEFHRMSVEPGQPSQLIQALEEAEENRNLIVIIVDPWTLRLEGYFAAMQDCDARENLQYAVAVPWNERDPETARERIVLDNIISDVFHNSSRKPPNYFMSRLTTPGDLQSRLAVSLEHMRSARRGADDGDGSALPLVSPL